MAKAIIAFAMTFLDVDTLCTLIAKAISCILHFASKKGGKAWDIAKDAVSKVNIWTSLFLQVYDDDKMSAEEEAIVACAIKNGTNIAKVVDLLKKNSKKTSAKTSSAKKKSSKSAKKAQ